jgi:hypothetical protein
LQSISSSPKVRVSGCPQNELDRVGPVEVGEHEDVEQLGAGSRTEGVQALPEAALQLIRPHG